MCVKSASFVPRDLLGILLLWPTNRLHRGLYLKVRYEHSAPLFGRVLLCARCVKERFRIHKIHILEPAKVREAPDGQESQHFTVRIWEHCVVLTRGQGIHGGCCEKF